MSSLGWCTRSTCRTARCRLYSTDEADDADEDALTCPATVVSVDIHQSALANARSFYAQKKAAAAKTAKTVQAAEQAVKAAEKKAAQTVQSIKREGDDPIDAHAVLVGEV